MRFDQIAKAQGMYQPQFERDNCGIGLFAHINGEKTHRAVKNGIEILSKLDHRGGGGSDPNTGDGAGIMIQIPDRFFRKVCPSFELPDAGDYGVGMFFFHQDDSNIDFYKEKARQLANQTGLTTIGWRVVPTNVGKIGKLAQESAPHVQQFFVQKTTDMSDETFGKKLYVLRKQLEKVAKKHDHAFYIPSFSNQTIVFKGLLTSYQVDQFYVDLKDQDLVSAFSLVHSRFSTNTFPSWERAHPNRYLIHNGEINTLRGNINGMKAREKQLKSDIFGDDLTKLLPILDEEGSDSAVLDNALEFLMLSGKSPAHAAMMLIPEPWQQNPLMEKQKRAFYEYHSALTEEWDGPTSITFTNGKQIGAILDRNGLRPARYYVTHDDELIYASEAGVLDIDDGSVKIKDRLKPGKMLYVDLEKGKIISDEELKQAIVNRHPYQSWLDKHVLAIDEKTANKVDVSEGLVSKQLAFGYTNEVIENYLIPSITTKKDPIGAMGTDTPLAVLSQHKQSLFNYFKQLFAQVTNPPIDAYREKLVTSTSVWLGPEGDYLSESPTNCHRIKLPHPILNQASLAAIEAVTEPAFKMEQLDYLFKNDLKKALERMQQQALMAIESGAGLLKLSDKGINKDKKVIPVLLAVSSLHQFLIREGLRTKVSIIVETGEAKEVHHFATLIGYGADAILPYLVYETYQDLVNQQQLTAPIHEVMTTYQQVMVEGIVKVMSKMGISTIQSYRGAQIFEAIGLHHDVINEHFTGTASVLSGIDLATIQTEAEMFHDDGFKERYSEQLPAGSEFQWRKAGEHHAYNPLTLTQLQWAARRGDYQLFKRYSDTMNNEQVGFLRHLFTFKETEAIDINEVEPIEAILKRFKTGAMSYGSISEEAHQTLAIAMNRIGGKSNSGEGGENPNRYQRLENGDWKNSAIKQVASARFGVDSHYLVNANELQIKMAQGAKPGEGGHLPGEKVYPWIAKTRNATPGVDLISPPPHHDIYSIEDLAELIYDLKNANRHARISVKLAAKSGVGTIASGVAKGNADVISIVGYDGGTGASPKTSIKHAGLPFELGLTEAHQTLLINGLRERVTIETDGKLLTGRDVVLAAMFGAEEFGFATAPLVILGCVMMRVCHLDTCPVGVATQNPELRERFSGKPEHIVNFMTYIATEVREIMASLGIRKMDELVGRTDLLVENDVKTNHWKAKHLELERLTYQPIKHWVLEKELQNHQLDETLDDSIILPVVREAIKQKQHVSLDLAVTNVNRAVGTITGAEISRLHGASGLKEDTLELNLFGSAGQSLGAFIPSGLTLNLTGDANDYTGKGLSGGKIIVKTDEALSDKADETIIIGNVCFYGATRGEAYINGQAGERFAVRNSGATLVVEGVGDHGLEYMTGGEVVILGETGKNLAAGMSGGEAYLYAPEKQITIANINPELVHITPSLTETQKETVKQHIHKHYMYTHSKKAEHLLKNWDVVSEQFVHLIPKTYKIVTTDIRGFTDKGHLLEEAQMLAFNAIKAEKLKNNTQPVIELQPQKEVTK
ncbi:glutamate synthase (NADPH) large subunit [Streptohalobacillus salinus]|uniref:Glutamate synthase (NADPH) large subunit n=1 Tax=Streptohalobacillus salinus TaxID=621096 RepID=A0A2V3WCX4_9BACI|nr:glutamate synthase large subunit [Streptohalobacillus salinus]PXW91842.1 glutamate synthase (NADPH) large subunit [Streptohalobacillus salinus]